MDFSNFWKHATDSLMLLFTQHKTIRAFPLSVVTASLHHLPQMSGFNSHMQYNAFYRNLKRTCEDLLP